VVVALGRRNGRFLSCPRSTRLLAPFCAIHDDAADRGKGETGLPERDRGTVLGLHAVHEVEHVPFGLAREAVEEALGQVNTTAWPRIVMEGAVHLGLVALTNDRETVVEQHGAEISAGFKVVKVDAVRFCHEAPTRKELSW
jgi:hypothetical protein